MLSDRTQAPSGSGYALENRTIVSDVLPDLFGNSNVLRLAPFFRAQREALAAFRRLQQSAHRAAHSRPATTKPISNTPTSRAISASPWLRALTSPCATGCVFLKTVEGLEQVDVILRRVDDSFCDPLELRSDSLLGVPGLVDAIVAGNVGVANALGSGLIESAAIMPFLPGLSRPCRRKAQTAISRHLVVRPALCPGLGAQQS